MIFANLSERKATVMDHMRSYLPSTERAWALCEIYFEHAAWLYVLHPFSAGLFLFFY